MLGSLDTQLLFSLAFLTFQTKDNLTGGLSLLVKDGFGLTTETHLLGIVTPFALCEIGRLTRLVLSDLVDGMLLALTGAVSLTFFWNIHHGFLHKIRIKRSQNNSWHVYTRGVNIKVGILNPKLRDFIRFKRTHATRDQLHAVQDDCYCSFGSPVVMVAVMVAVDTHILIKVSLMIQVGYCCRRSCYSARRYGRCVTRWQADVSRW
jgi:hypothetical protein